MYCQCVVRFEWPVCTVAGPGIFSLNLIYRSNVTNVICFSSFVTGLHRKIDGLMKKELQFQIPNDSMNTAHLAQNSFFSKYILDLVCDMEGLPIFFQGNGMFSTFLSNLTKSSNESAFSRIRLCLIVCCKHASYCRVASA